MKITKIKNKMYRTHTCGELRIENKGEKVTLAGWVQRVRNMGGLTFIDLRDRYGITQLAFNMDTNAELCENARKLGREYVIQATGVVTERESKNKQIATGEVELIVSEIKVLNASETPPFTIEDESDGGDELRLKYRYLDLRRNPLQRNLMLRHSVGMEVRKYLDSKGFIDVETPFLIKSTPEGARDFIVPSRMNKGEFYALPQSPQVFKQLLMVSGYDRYFQIVKCFRDEDLRADRQPEFTQIDCEMAFVQQEDVLATFEGMTKHIFKEIKGVSLSDFPKMTYADAMENYGSDKPDTRFEMLLKDITKLVQIGTFRIFDSAEYIGAICVKGTADYSRKQLDELTDFVKRPQVGAMGMVYVKYNADGSFKSSVDKFYDAEQLQKWADFCGAEKGDLLLVLSGEKAKTQVQLSALRLEMGKRLGLMDKNNFKPLWVVDFPLFEWDEETARFYAMHHPFTSPKEEDFELLETNPGKVRANAYDLVINGVEIGGGSVRIYNQDLQRKIFSLLGFTNEEAENQFGFLMNAFRYGAPPHAGVAYGFDRLVSMFAGKDSIRDVIAFPKNNMGRDVMMDSPSTVAKEQLDELGLMKIEKNSSSE